MEQKRPDRSRGSALQEEIVVSTGTKERVGNGFVTLLLIALLLLFTLSPRQPHYADPFIFLFFLLMAGMAIFYFIDSFAVVTAKSDGIFYKWPFRSVKQLDLSQIASICHRHGTRKMLLCDNRGRNRVKVHESAPAFADFFDYLRIRRPDLWPTLQDNVFHRKITILILFLLPIFFILGNMIFLAAKHALTIQLLIFSILGIFFLAFTLAKQPLSVEISSSNLYVQYALKREDLPVSSIEHIRLSIGKPNASFAIEISISQGRSYLLSGFRRNEALIFDRIAILLPEKVVKRSYAG